MLELAADLLPLVRAGESVVAVTVTRVARSAPRGVGATLAVTASGQVIGSISGGCVEGDCVMLAMSVLATGRAQTAGFGFSDESAHAAGLACGGSVDVLAYPVTAEHLPLLELAADDRAVTVGVHADGPLIGTVVAGAMLPVRDDVDRALRLRASVLVRDPDLLVVSRAPRPRLIVLGASEHAAALCRIGHAAGFAVTVCDAWELLVTRERFPEAERLEVGFPHEYLASLGSDDVDARTAICVLTHDERLDVPALRVALSMPVGFVGALGARSTVARRDILLDQAGVSAADRARLHSPLGLDLGGASPEETAISVLAEIISARNGASGAPLRERSGPLHRRDEGSREDAAGAGAPGPAHTAIDAGAVSCAVSR